MLIQKVSKEKILGIALLVFTAVIIIYPTQLLLIYTPVGAPYVFQNLPLFLILYNAWFILIIANIVLHKRSAGKQAIILCLFSLVFLGIWIFLTPYGQSADTSFQMGHVQYILDNNRVDPDNPLLAYFQAPGLSILTASLARVTGLTVFMTSSIYLIVSAIALTFIVFVGYRAVLTQSFQAAIATLLLIHANITITISQDFHPQNLAFLFFASFLLLFFSRKLEPRRQLVFITLYGGLITAYVSLSFAILFILLALLLVVFRNRSHKEERNQKLLLNLTLLSMLIFVCWQVYQATRLFTWTTLLLPDIFNRSLQDRVSWLITIGQANVGQQIPLWANISRLFWLFLIFGVGSILALRWVIKLKKIDAISRNILACLIGCIVFATFAFIISPAGGQFHRFLLYVPFLMTPIIMLTFKSRRYFNHFVVILLIALSCSTFLAYNGRITYSSIYHSEVQAGNIIAQSFGRGDNTEFYTSVWSGSFTYLKSYDASIVNEGDPAYNSTSDYWNQVGVVIQYFERHLDEHKNKLFIYSVKFKMEPQHILGISPNATDWNQYFSQLYDNNQVYSNGDITFFTPS
jgi:hypothetical protein